MLIFQGVKCNSKYIFSRFNVHGLLSLVLKKASCQHLESFQHDRAETASACAKTRNFEPPSSLKQIPKLSNTPYFLPKALNS